MNQHRFEQLVQSLLDGSCDPGDFEALQRELEGSPERRRVLRDSYLLHEMLAVEATLNSPARLSRKVVPVEEFLRKQRRRTLRIAMIAAAAVVMLAALVLQLIHADAAVPGLRFAAAPNSKFTVSHRERGSAPEDELRPGSEVDLLEGTLELKFSNGVRSIVQAPARFVFHDPMRLGMNHGIARFEVPGGARGFTVLTPSLNVVDLGTEFGIVERPERMPQVHVFKGRVQVTARQGLRASRILNAGVSAAATIAGRLETIPSDSSLFFRELPPGLPYLHFPFERDDTGKLVIEGYHPALESTVARVRSGGPGWVEGVKGKAARFSGKATPIESNWNGIEGDAPRTISAWIRQPEDLPFRPYQTIVAWGDPTIGMAGKCELLLFRPKAGERTVLRLSFDQFLFSGSTDLADGEWHHVAAVCHGTKKTQGNPVVDLYVDGVLEIIDPGQSNTNADTVRGAHTRTGVRGSTPLVIGYTERPQRGRGFRGDIDEVTVFEAALGPDRVKELATRP